MSHPKNFWRSCASIVLCAVLASTAQADTSRKEFTAALQKWQAAGIHDYSFTLSWSCECLATQPIRITVQGDKIQSARNPGIWGFFTPVSGTTLTMNQLFQKIEEAYAGGAAHIVLTLNKDYSYPESIAIDYDEPAVDDEIIYYINDFTR
jgi:hypothetical protein